MRATEILNEIEEVTREQENAIRSHGREMVAAFMKRKSAVIEAANFQWEFDTPQLVQPSRNELQQLNDYVCVSSFISAWYHLSGMRAKRDQAAHSCSNLIAGLGFEPDQVLARYIAAERLWRSELKQAGLAPRSRKLIKVMLIFALAAGVAYLAIK